MRGEEIDAAEVIQVRMVATEKGRLTLLSLLSRREKISTQIVRFPEMLLVFSGLAQQFFSGISCQTKMDHFGFHPAHDKFRQSLQMNQ
jgi:hypothetical protein